MSSFEQAAVFIFIFGLTSGFILMVVAVCAIAYWDTVYPDKGFIETYIIESSYVMEKFSDYYEKPCIYFNRKEKLLRIGVITVIEPGIDEPCKVKFRDYLDLSSEHLIDPNGVAIRFRTKHLEKVISLINPNAVMSVEFHRILWKLKEAGFFNDFGIKTVKA